MNAIRSSLSLKPVFLSALCAALMCGCSGGSSTASADGAQAAPSAAAPGDKASGSVSQPAPLPDLAAPDTSKPPLTMPANVASGSTVELECGRTYQGTLDLKGKSNVTVRTAGDCGKAVLSPGQALTGWTHYQGNIYSAPVSFDVAQLLIDGKPVSAAHWPNRPQTWAKAAGASATSLSYAMPNADLAGATLVFRPYEWAIEARKITSYAGGSMSLASTGNLAYDGYELAGQPDFYVEGKLWMLDEPGEWAVSGGRLYVWTPDGQSPEGRAWASPDRHGIDASDSTNVSIAGLKIYGAADGIHAFGAYNLKVSGVDIANSSENGIVNSGGSGLAVDGATIRNSRHDAITVHWGGGNEVIRNTSIDTSGLVGMPANARAAINLTASIGATVQNNNVTNSGYIGIRVFRNATVAQNMVDGACSVLTDCGGIFTSARDKQPLNTRIVGNIVKNVNRSYKLSWGLYLSDYANGVTVTDNILTANYNGINLFDGFNNSITGNWFSASTQAHIQMHESGSTPVVRYNTVSGNTFTAADGEETYRLSSDLGTASVAQFGSYNNNTYTSSSPVFANFNGEALSFSQWRTRTGQDTVSTFNAR